MFIAMSLLFSLMFTSVNAAEVNVTVEAKITGLYVAFFNRAADQKGLDYWVAKTDEVAQQGGDVSSVFKIIAGGFATHPTFKSTYDHLENKAFVEAIYKNALGRDGDAKGIAYWTDLVERAMSRPDMVAAFVELAMVTDLTAEKYKDLSDEDRVAAQLRQDLITNKATVAVAFTKQLEELSNVENNDAPESDPAYIASIMIISGVTEDKTTVLNATAFLRGIIGNSDPVGQINEAKLKVLLAGKTLYTTIWDDIGTMESWTFNADLNGASWRELVGGSESGTVTVNNIAGMTITVTDDEGITTIVVKEILTNYLLLEVTGSELGDSAETLRLYFDEAKARAYLLAAGGDTGSDPVGSDLAGTEWSVVETVLTNTCILDPGTQSYEMTIVSYSDGALTVDTPAGTFNGTYSGSTISYSGSYTRSEGTATASVALTANTGYDKLTGTSTYTLKGEYLGIPIDCGGTTNVVATRQ